MSRQSRSTGFTLIELMIVVGIIATLATIAIPLYQGYVARAQAAAGLSEVTSAHTAYELLLSHDASSDESYTNVENLGLPASTSNCTLTATAPIDGKGSIRCTLKGSALVKDRYIDLVRDIEGQWKCVSNLALRHMPKSCTPPE